MQCCHFFEFSKSSQSVSVVFWKAGQKYPARRAGPDRKPRIGRREYESRPRLCRRCCWLWALHSPPLRTDGRKDGFHPFCAHQVSGTERDGTGQERTGQSRVTILEGAIRMTKESTSLTGEITFGFLTLPKEVGLYHRIH